MKRLLLSSVLIVAVITYCDAQNAKETKGPVITWENSSHDFGDIVQGDKVEHTFRFTNTGNQPLIITNVEVTCGCTTPKGWPRDPIAPGETGEITVAFNSAGKSGKQTKVTMLTSNSAGSTNQVMFTANVLGNK